MTCTEISRIRSTLTRSEQRKVSSWAIFEFLCSWFLLDNGLWISWKNQTLPNLRLLISADSSPQFSTNEKGRKNRPCRWKLWVPLNGTRSGLGLAASSSFSSSLSVPNCLFQRSFRKLSRRRRRRWKLVRQQKSRGTFIFLRKISFSRQFVTGGDHFGCSFERSGRTFLSCVTYSSLKLFERVVTSSSVLGGGERRKFPRSVKIPFS